MSWNLLKTELNYRSAVLRTFSIFHAQEDTPEADELAILLFLIKDYEDRTIVMPEIDILEVIKGYLQNTIRY